MKKENEIETVSYSLIVEDVEPPPPNYRGESFNSIKEWLTGICDAAKPPGAIDEFSVGLFEGEDYCLFLVGKQDSVAGNDHYSKIVFEPQFMYYQLPKVEYASLPREQLLVKISEEIKEFTSSNKFKSCFFSEAKSFILEYNGKNLLHR